MAKLNHDELEKLLEIKNSQIIDLTKLIKDLEDKTKELGKINGILVTENKKLKEDNYSLDHRVEELTTEVENLKYDIETAQHKEDYKDVVKYKAIEELKELRKKYDVVKENNVALAECCEKYKKLCAEMSKTNDDLIEANRGLMSKCRRLEKEKLGERDEPEESCNPDYENSILEILYSIVFGF